MSQPQAFILHLARATARRANAETLAAGCGLEAELWPATDGKALGNEALMEPVRDHLFDPRYPFALKPGEVGCFLSHRSIWAEIVARGLDHALVLEDDVALDDGFVRALALARKHAATYGYVQLQNRPARGPAEKVDQNGDAVLSHPTITPVRASAQVISRAGARRLLDHADRFDRPVDTYVQSHWITGLRPAVIYPAGVRTISDDLDGSTIQNGHKTVAERAAREIARARYRRALRRASQGSTADFHLAGGAA